MAWKHARVMSPAQALAQRGLLFANAKPAPRGPAQAPKGKVRVRKARAEYLKAAETMRRAARMMIAKVETR